MDAAVRSLQHFLGRRGARIVVSIAALALVTGAIYVLQPVAPILSLGVLYVFAVLPVAVIGGLPYALPVALASMLAFNWLFLPPKYTLELRESENWVALKAESSDVLSPTQQKQVADGLEENAKVITNTHLEELLAGQPPDVREEILRINEHARPIALQIALLIPLGAALLGLLNGFRMTRLPDPESSGTAASVLGG